jgi:hypothetical protein
MAKTSSSRHRPLEVVPWASAAPRKLIVNIDAINAYLQRALVSSGLDAVDAVTAASWLERAGLLRDSPARPGFPLRRLLRDGRIKGQQQAANGRWTIHRHQDARPGESRSAARPNSGSGNRVPKQPDSGSTARDLIEQVGLVPAGHARWGGVHNAARPGVYIIEWDLVTDEAPIDIHALDAWIARLPTLRLDGLRPTPTQLAARLSQFWIAATTVVYIGLTTSTVSKRLRQYERTPLGDRRPHAGGHWLKTLRDFESRATVTWAHTIDVASAELALVDAFGVTNQGLLPFANLMHPAGTRKPHGITGATL